MARVKSKGNGWKNGKSIGFLYFSGLGLGFWGWFYSAYRKYRREANGYEMNSG